MKALMFLKALGISKHFFLLGYFLLVEHSKEMSSDIITHISVVFLFPALARSFLGKDLFFFFSSVPCMPSGLAFCYLSLLLFLVSAFLLQHEPSYVATGELPTLQCLVSYPRTDGQDELNLVGYLKSKRRGWWGIRTLVGANWGLRWSYFLVYVHEILNKVKNLKYCLSTSSSQYSAEI